jgi:hypothetical protein
MTRTRIVMFPLLLVVLGLLSLQPAQAGAAPAQSDGTLLKWRGKARTVHLPTTPEMIPGAPRSFRTFAKEQLREAWVHDFDHKPACKQAPTIMVKSLRTDGFALGDVGEYAQPGCPAGGGYVAFWAIRHGAWKEVIATQDVVECGRLEQLGFPSALGVHECWDGHHVVPYSHA